MAPVPSADLDAGLTPASTNGETDEDEERWERSLAEGDSGALAGAEDSFETMPNQPAAPEETGPVPDLEEVLKKVPASSQELIDALFRGRFTSVQVVKREELY